MIEVYRINCKGAVGRAAEDKLSARRQWWEAIVKGEAEEVWERREFSFCFGTCAHWPARVYGYFEAGFLMGLFAFNLVVAVSHSTLLRLPLLKLVA